jgi:hypothetical protein
VSTDLQWATLYGKSDRSLFFDPAAAHNILEGNFDGIHPVWFEFENDRNTALKHRRIHISLPFSGENLSNTLKDIVPV